MIEVRVKELEIIVNKYNSILDQINENNTDLFGCFTDMSKYWNDDRKINLYTSYIFSLCNILYGCFISSKK